MTKRSREGVRLWSTYGLTLLLFMGLAGCAASTENDQIRISWQDKTARGVFIPRKLVEGLPSDSVSGQLSVRLVGTDPAVAMLGEYRVEPETILFTPLVPFTRGLQYEVVRAGTRVGTFAVPLADPADAPALVRMYPSQDTLPENLLKVYLHFSQPMQEGRSADYVHLVRDQTDTVRGAFLNLQPELWNEDRTILTLWLDPGRIKRDLHPNRQLGAPLQKDGRYQIVVSSGWKDQQGSPLPQRYFKSFVVTDRDSLSPVPARWSVVSPPAGTVEALRVHFTEPLDHSLLAESLRILDANGKPVEGNWVLSEEEKSADFRPAAPWAAGTYTLRVRTVLEDLAGNNLNRPFDRDLTRKQTAIRSEEFMEVVFVVGR